MAQQNPNMDETPPPRDARVSLNSVFYSKTVLTYNFQDDEENTLPPPSTLKPNPT